MPFENEFASYEPLRRVLENPKVQALQKRLKVKKVTEEDQKILEGILVSKTTLTKSDWMPDMVLAIDGSYHATKIENGFPGAEIGYVTVASVIIMLEKINELMKNEFVDPQEFRKTEKASTIDSVYPGCNIVIDDEDSAKSSFRKCLFNSLKEVSVFSEGETLLDTYEYLLGLKLKKDERENNINFAKSPIEDIDEQMMYGLGEFKCPHTGKILYSTDALRLHELLNSSGTCGEMYGQVMSMLEKLWLVHILRAFEKKGWLATLRRMAFILDGPLACFSTWSWINKPLVEELSRINEIQKKINESDLLIIGIEKSGTFCNHFEDLDITIEGVKDKIPNGTAILLNDIYIKNNIIFSDSKKPYGIDTYFGRKFFYKTINGYKIVAVVAFFNDKQADIRTATPDQFSRIVDIMNLLDKLVSNRYVNSVSPLVSAHAEAAIPLNLGKKIFEQIASEIRDSQ